MRYAVVRGLWGAVVRKCRDSECVLLLNFSDEWFFRSSGGQRIAFNQVSCSLGGGGREAGREGNDDDDDDEEEEGRMGGRSTKTRRRTRGRERGGRGELVEGGEEEERGERGASEYDKRCDSVYCDSTTVMRDFPT